VEAQFGHEKLHVYRHGLTFVSWKESLLVGIDMLNTHGTDHTDQL